MKKEKEKTGKEKQRSRTVQLFLWTGVILIQMSVVKRLDVYAMAGQNEGEWTMEGNVEAWAADNGEKWMARKENSRITVWSEDFLERESCPVPENVYVTEEGEEYGLDSWEAKQILMPAKRIPVEREVSTEAVEGSVRLPESVTAEARDRGRAMEVSCHLKEKTVTEEQWQEGFWFPVTFHKYDAGFYWLGEHLIEGKEEKPLPDGCEGLLLEEIGVSPEDYEITAVRWDGDPYMDEGGELCRNGIASGRKRLRDYRLVYEGIAEFPEYYVWRTEAIYELAGFEEETETKEQEREKEPVIVEIDETQPAEAAWQEPLTVWERIKRTLLVTIAIGALLFFGGLVVLGLLWLARIFLPYKRREGKGRKRNSSCAFFKNKVR